MISIAMEKVEVLQSILQSSSFDFQAACGKSPKTILTAAKYVNEQLCSTATCLGEVRSLFGCSYWQPLYSSAVYETTCYNSAEGFAYVAITQLIIVFVAMLVLTLRVAFYPVSVLGDANSDHDGGYIVINNDETESTTGKENRTTPLVVIRQQGAAAGNKMDDEETGALLAQAPEVPESSLVSSGPVAPLTANSQKEITFDPMEFTLEGLGDDETPPPPLPSDPGDFKHGVYALPSITEESVPQSSYNQSFRSRGGDNEKSKLLTTSSSVSEERELLEKEKYGEIEDDQPFEEDEIHPVFMLVRSRPTLADQPPMVAIETEDAKNIEKQEVISWGDFPDDISSGSSTQNTSIKSEPTPSKDDPLLKTYYSDTDLDLESDIPREGEDHASTAGSRSQNSNGLSQRADSDDDSDDDFEFPPPSESNKSFPSGIKTLSALAQEKDDGDSEVPSLEESSESESSTRELDSLRERSNSDDDIILSPMIQPNKNVDEQLPSTEQAGEDPSGDGQQAAEELERKRQTVLPMFERLSSSENTNASMKDDAEKAGQEPSEMPMFERLSSSENSSASIRDDAEKVGQELSEMPPEVLPMFERLSSSESSHTSMKNNAEKAVQNLGSEQDELLPVFDRVSSSENSDASMTNNAEQAAQELASEHQETVSVFERLSSIEHKDGEVNDDDASHDSSLDEQEMRDTFPSVTAPDLSPALSPNTLFRRKSTDIFKGGVNKLVMIQKFLGKSYGLVEGEKKTDLASFERSLTKFVDWDDEDDESFEEAGKVRFSKHVKKFKIEDLTKRDTTWGDIWDHLYFDEDTLAEFKYAAYMEECGLVEGGVLDDDDEDVELSLEEITKIVLAEHATYYPNSAVSADSKIKSSLDTSSSSPKRESLSIAEHANDVVDQLLSDTGSDKVEYYDEEIIDDPSIRLPLSRRSSSGAEEVSMTESDLMSSDGNFVNPLLSDPEAVDLQNTDDGHMSIFLDIGKYNKSMSDDSTLGDTSRQPSEGDLEEEEGHSSM